jgi:hypothetical protein
MAHFQSTRKKIQCGHILLDSEDFLFVVATCGPDLFATACGTEDATTGYGLADDWKRSRRHSNEGSSEFWLNKCYRI